MLLIALNPPFAEFGRVRLSFALEVFREAGATHYIATAERLLARIG